MREFKSVVTKEDEGLGVKRILRKHFDFSSRLFNKLKAQERIFLNGQVIRGWMQPKAGDVILVRLPEETSQFPEEDIPFGVIYEDDDLLVIDKPAGYIVHPTKGHPSHTMANGLMKYIRETGQSFKIRFVNRLDMDTSGLLIIGKNSHAQDDLSRQMHENKLNKYYMALVIGTVEEDEFTIDLPIAMTDPERIKRSVVPAGEGRDCVTHVKVLERFPKGYTLVRLKLETGRTHQIRVHLSHIGHPIAGDHLYGGDRPLLIDRQALHAFRVEFRHPAEDRMIECECPLPDDILKAIDIVKQN